MKNNSNLTQEACQLVIERAQEGQIEALALGKIQQQEDIDILATYRDCRSLGESYTRLNAYYIQFMENLGAIEFVQSITYKYAAVIAKNVHNDIVGVIMPIRID